MCSSTFLCATVAILDLYCGFGRLWCGPEAVRSCENYPNTNAYGTNPSGSRASFMAFTAHTRARFFLNFVFAVMILSNVVRSGS